MRRPSLRLRSLAGGFSLLQVITATTVVGVLATAPLPRYGELQGDARAAKMKAVAGSLRAATALAKGQALVNGVDCRSPQGGQVTMEAALIDLMYCAPAASASGIERAANLNSAVDRMIITHGTRPAPADPAAVVDNPGRSALRTTIRLATALKPATCLVTYDPPDSAHGAAQVAVVTEGC